MAPFLSAVQSTAVSVSCNSSLSPGTVMVNISGIPIPLPVLVTHGATDLVSITNGTKLTLLHGSRAYLGSTCVDNFEPDSFAQLDLMGRVLSFETDLSRVSCGCNAAFYLVSMPAIDDSGTPAPTHDGDYYCGANAGKHGGVYCPEIDIMEANRAAMHITPHRCDPPAKSGHYTACDGPGYNLTTQSNPAFGPRAVHGGIDTRLPFRQSMHFATCGGDDLCRIETTLTQGTSQLRLVHDNVTYVQDLSRALDGMVAVFSHWGFGGNVMQWLDVPPCDVQAACDATGQVTFSDLAISARSR